MKKLLLLPALFCILIWTACAQQKKTTGSDDITYIKMVRSSCYGTCPAYDVEIYKNGLVRYTGKLFTDYKGVYEHMADTKEVRQLFNKFEEYRVDTCKEEYTALITDVPGIYYNIKYGNKTKKIDNAHFGPDFLKRLARDVDSFANVGIGWKKVSDTIPTNR